MATAEFQRLSEAYNVLLKHLDRSAPSPRPHSYAPFDYNSDGYEGSEDGYYNHNSDYDEYSDDDFESYSQTHFDPFAFFM